MKQQKQQSSGPITYSIIHSGGSSGSSSGGCKTCGGHGGGGGNNGVGGGGGGNKYDPSKGTKSSGKRNIIPKYGPSMNTTIMICFLFYIRTIQMEVFQKPLKLSVCVTACR